MVYDLIVIGAGPAGYLAAERAGREGWGVLIRHGTKYGVVAR